MTQRMDETEAVRPTVVETGSPPLAGERVAFTGTLASMTHKQAAALAEQNGGIATTDVSRQTTMLVVGEEGWPLEPDGRPALKWQHACAFRDEGAPIRILTESEWLRLLGLEDQSRDVRRVYTPATLSQLLGVSVGAIRSWERLGLIRAVRKVYRLPYFEFNEVASARRISQLLADGVSRDELARSLNNLRSVVPGVERPLEQLEILARNARLLYRDDHGLLDTISGQRCFDFRQNDPQPADVPKSTILSLAVDDENAHVSWSADDWYHQGLRLLEQNEPAEAIEAFRLALLDRPGDAEINFSLAEALYRTRNTAGAIERYYATVEADRYYLEAWTQLGCVHAEQGELESALHAFQIALDVYPEYPDAHWQIADVLDQLGRRDEAAVHWRMYLKHDDHGPWAEQARHRLDELEQRDEPSA